MWTCLIQIHSAEAAAQPWGPNSHQEVSTNNSSQLCSLVLISTFVFVFSRQILCSHFCVLLKSLISSIFLNRLVCKIQRDKDTARDTLKMCHARLIWARSDPVTFRSSHLGLCHKLFVNSPHPPTQPLHHHDCSNSVSRQATVHLCDNPPQSHRGKQWVSSQSGRETLLAV